MPQPVVHDAGRGTIGVMEDEDYEARQPEDFNWFAPWQWEWLVLFRVSLVALGLLVSVLVICCVAILCGGVCSIHGR